MNVTNAAHGEAAGPCTMIIFGATGDLTKRLLLPSLYHLAKSQLLPENFAIYGFAVDPLDTNAFRDHVVQSLNEFAGEPVEPAIAQWFHDRSYYSKGDFQNPDSFVALKADLAHAEREQKTEGNRLFYFAVAPRFIGPIAQQLNASGLSCEEDGRWRRIIVEKPFGHDLESAQALNRELSTVFQERQIFRIDHFQGKETVQDITVFRFSNSIFEPLWNRSHIDHVQITATETVGVEHRGGYYETSGALRDMLPNHLAKVLSLIAMEPPVSFSADDMRNKQAEALKAITPITEADVPNIAVRGQYQGYRQEEGVAPESVTETYAAMKVHIDNWRWAGVPFYLRTGKRLKKTLTEVVVHFRVPPFVLFRDTPVESLPKNHLLMRIKPNPGIALRFGVKAAGPVTTVEMAEMDFNFPSTSEFSHGTGYERLLHDCMLGDATLFQRADMVDDGWRMVQPVLNVWAAERPTDFPNYAADSWGPAEADELLAKDGFRWRSLE